MFIVFDIETNGIGTFRPPSQTITQLSFIKFNISGEIIEQYSTYVKGAKQLSNHPSVKSTFKQINSGIDVIQAIKTLFDSIDDPNIILCSHNYEFDSGLIKNVIDDNSQLIFPLNPTLCTMKSFTNYCKLPKPNNASKYSGYKYPKLEELVDLILKKRNKKHLTHAGSSVSPMLMVVVM